MAEWDFGGAFGRGFGQGFETGKHRLALARQERADALAAQERDRKSAERAEDVGFKERDQMRSDQEMALRERLGKAEIEYKGRMPHDRPGSAGSETAVGAKIKALGDEIGSITTRAEGAGSKWYLPKSWEKEKISDEDARLREQLKSRYRGLLGVGIDRKAIYMKARQEGKSEAEARSLAGG